MYSEVDLDQANSPNAEVCDLTPTSGIASVRKRMLDRRLFKHPPQAVGSNLSHKIDGGFKVRMSDQGPPPTGAVHYRPSVT